VYSWVKGKKIEKNMWGTDIFLLSGFSQAVPKTLKTIAG
jgi:hypothetical protein